MLAYTRPLRHSDYALKGTIRIWRRAPHRPVWREEGARPNPVSIFAGDVVAALRRHLNQGNFTGRPGPWCAWGLSAALVESGHRPLASGLASSALSYGPRLSGPLPGAIAALGDRRGRIYHVGVVESVEGDRVGIISANWSHKVSRAVLPRRAFAAFIGV